MEGSLSAPGNLLLQGFPSVLEGEDGIQEQSLLSGEVWPIPVALLMMHMVMHSAEKSAE